MLLGGFGEEGVAGVLAEAGRPAEGRARGKFREGEDAHRFERGLFAVADVRQSAELERGFAQSDQQDGVC